MNEKRQNSISIYTAMEEMVTTDHHHIPTARQVVTKLTYKASAFELRRMAANSSKFPVRKYSHLPPAQTLVSADQSGTYDIQVILTLQNLPPKRHWLEVSDFTEAKAATCTVLALSRPIGTDALESTSNGEQYLMAELTYMVLGKPGL